MERAGKNSEAVSIKPDYRIAVWIVPVIYWLALYTFTGSIEKDHLVYGGTILLLYHLGSYGPRILGFLLPFVLTGMIYDSQRFWAHMVRPIPHIADLYYLEKQLFGIRTEQGVLTPNEWFGHHLHPFFDFITGLAYLTFVGVFMLTALYLSYRLYKEAGENWPADRRKALMSALPWSFLIVNLMGYTTWLLFPAAPPWYVEQYGLDTVLEQVPVDPARTVRFDALLGTSFFTDLYGYESNAYGALPSLHISYPTISFFYAFRIGSARIFSAVFLVLMCFSAVYLNHHYLIDVILGSLYGVIAAVLTPYLINKWAK
jgi:membrane-associated phospholipid phosphatase